MNDQYRRKAKGEGWLLCQRSTLVKAVLNAGCVASKEAEEDFAMAR